MSCFYLSIEKNREAFELYRVLWNAQGIEGLLADTMTEGIERAIEIERSGADELFFIDIVADDIDFMPQLKILSEATGAPILIATSRYDEIEREEALNNGADAYGAYSEVSEQQDVNGVIAVVNSIHQRSKKQKKPRGVLVHGDILIAADSHAAYIKDKELRLSKAEMDIMRYLMINRGNILPYGRLLEEVYGGGEATPDTIYSAMKRLRKKTRGLVPFDYIQTVRGIGYRLVTKSE